MKTIKKLLLLTFACLSIVSCQKNITKKKSSVIHVSSLSEFKEYLNKDNIIIKLKEGNYQIDDAENIRLMQFTGSNSYFDLNGARFMFDTKLFSRTDLAKSDDGNSMYCAIEVKGNNVTIEGLYVETYGDQPGRQSKNKIFNIAGENVTLKDVEVRTSGSSPWGYGYLYGLGGGDVRKMNGIRVGYPAKNTKLIGCKVHMRAMGHAIFLQGSVNTLIEDCHVDGLLRTTDAILKETSGYGFDRDFYVKKGGYVEGTLIGKDAKILPGEMVSLSEDGIRMYPSYNGHKTISTTVKNCTVRQMRRGICTGLSTSGDKVISCEVRDCVATGYNIGNNDTLVDCSADAKFGEAFCIPYLNAKNAYVEMNIFDSRDGRANELLAKINGTGHHVIINTESSEYIPNNFAIKMGTWQGYGNYDKKATMHSTDVKLINNTNCEVWLYPGVKNENVESQGKVHRKITQDERLILN